MRRLFVFSLITVVLAGCSGSGGGSTSGPSPSSAEIVVESFQLQAGTVLGCQIVGVVRNDSARTLTAILTFDMFDANGVVIGRAVPSVQGVQPGARANFSAIVDSTIRALVLRCSSISRTELTKIDTI